MEALELIRVGRTLTKLGEAALREGEPAGLPNGPSLVLRDVSTHSGTSIKEIAKRTGLPQSYVSESVGRLRSEQAVAVREDPRDRRRTLVTVTARHREAVDDATAATVDGVIAAAVGRNGAPEVLRACELLAKRLRPERLS